MFLPVLTNLVLLISFSILIFWPLFNNVKISNLARQQSPIFSLIVGFFFAVTAIFFHYLSPGLADNIFSNSRILLILYSGLVGGPIAVLTSSSLIVFSRDFLGSITELTTIMKWHTLFTGILIALSSIKKPITLKNLHYYYAITLIQFSIVIFVCHLVYKTPLSALANFIVFISIAYVCIYSILKKYNDLAIQLSAMRQLHRTDYLTDLPNNLASEEYLQQLLSKKTPFELLHIDIDMFKTFNAEQTYRAGDEILRQIASIFSSISIEKNAYVGRIGGDEFCFILTNSNPASAVHIANEISRKINETTFYFNEQPFSLSVSICVCSYPQNGKTLEELYYATINGLKVLTSSGSNNVAHVNQLKLEGKLT